MDMSSDSESATISKNIGRGHVELLMPMIEGCLEQASGDYRQIERIAVVNGPGSFAGLRVGISTAKGLSISLGIPAVGIGTLEAIAQSARDSGYAGRLMSILSAKRGEFYFRSESDGASRSDESGIAGLEILSKMVSGKGFALCGAGANDLNEAIDEPLPIIHEMDAPDVIQVARMGALKRLGGASLEPVYFRPPDIKPQTNFVLPRV